VGIPESDDVMIPCLSEEVELRICFLNGHLSTTSPGTSDYMKTLLELVDLYRTKISLTDDLTDIQMLV